jgi:hypothetical protein
MIGCLFIAMSLQATAPFLDSEADSLRYPCSHTILMVDKSTSDHLSTDQHQFTFCLRVFVELSSQACADASTRSCTHSANSVTKAEQRTMIQQALKHRISKQNENNRSAEIYVPQPMSRQDTTLSAKSCNTITIP